ncbi:DUF3412 domain-containing protein, partial [Vibrio vulnificus]|nr:DUF3412 domain-containing protein [Vibrio vulnificus]
GPKESEAYFRSIDQFIASTLGEEARKHYTIVIDDPVQAARIMKDAMPLVRQHRKDHDDAYSYNWSLKIEPEFQLPFDPTHDSMASLDLHLN